VNDWKETPADREHEHNAADVIREARRCGVFVFPAKSPVDLLMYDHTGITGLGEFKRRGCEFGRHPDEMLRRDKWPPLLALADIFRVPVEYFAGHTDGIYSVVCVESNVVRYGNENIDDRGGRYGLSPSVHLNNNAFRKVGP
jgi:hypothetical protein